MLYHQNNDMFILAEGILIGLCFSFLLNIYIKHQCKSYYERVIKYINAHTNEIKTELTEKIETNYVTALKKNNTPTAPVSDSFIDTKKRKITTGSFHLDHDVRKGTTRAANVTPSTEQEKDDMFFINSVGKYAKMDELKNRTSTPSTVSTSCIDETNQC